MNIHDKRVRIALLILAALLSIIGYRIVSNILARNAEAGRSGQRRAAVVTTSHALRKTIVPKFKFAGSLDPVWQADVAAKVDGRIEKVLVQEGDSVSAGDALLLLEQTDTNAGLLAAKGAYIDAETNLQKAQTDLSRYETLYKSGAVSKETLDHMRFALTNAEGKLDAAKGSLDAALSRQGGTTVTTPRAGIVQKRYYQEGYYAKTGTALFNIADISTLSAKIDVPEGYVQSISVGGAVEFNIPSMSGADKHVTGTITKISPVASLPSRTFEAEVSVPNSDYRLRGGVYADTVITASPKENVLTVPLSAIVMRDDQRTVYVVENGIAVRKVLKVGYIGDESVEILDGITEKDTIIIGGQNKVREGGPVEESENSN